MTRRLTAPLSLSRKRIRPSFNKWNIYNALTWRKTQQQNTQYRQVFFAKQETRAYHGDRLTETQFRNHFRGELPTVNSLAGGAGDENVPYALQTFVGLERRLDMAVFRALFASSVRQAAVFVLRGGVKVNGVRIRAPGYILRPGDMFSVDPRRVLYALGRPKPSLAESVKYTNRIIKKFNDYIDKCHANPEKMYAERARRRRRHHVYNKRWEASLGRRRHAQHQRMQAEIDAVTPVGMLRQALKGELGAAAEPVVGVVRQTFPEADLANEAEALAQRYFGVSDSTSPQQASVPRRSDVKKLAHELVQTQQAKIRESYAELERGDGQKYDPSWLERLPAKIEPLNPEASPEELQAVQLKLPFSTTGGKLYGLSEPAKPWFTPWTPRQFLAPMAILPHHLEVSFETCHAVYLRDPVARPGHSEVISPFALDMHERAYLWYVYRRRKNLPPL